jgi:hypothetical protein
MNECGWLCIGRSFVGDCVLTGELPGAVTDAAARLVPGGWVIRMIVEEPQ